MNATTQRPMHNSNLEDSILKKKAEECVQYILYCYLAESKAMIRRKDLNDHVITTEYSKSFRQIFERVEAYLNDVFGLKVIGLDGETFEKSEKFGLKSKFKFDCDLNRTELLETAETDKEMQERVKYSIIMISLSVIFMNNEEIDEGLFFETLKKLDINRDDKKNKYLGDVNNYFTKELVKEGYLDYEKIKNTEPSTYKFKWGQRSYLEISKKSVLKFVCKVYDGCDPKDWIAQYENACRQETDLDDHVFATRNNPISDDDEELLTEEVVRRPTATASRAKKPASKTRESVYDDIMDSEPQQSQVVVQGPQTRNLRK